MPKVIDNVREKAIAFTRQILHEQGYDALAMRDVAAGCNVAVGTMYNYFPSKEYLTGCVVLEDWETVYGEMSLLAGTTDSLGHGLDGIYTLMRRFIEEHTYLTTFDRRQARGKFAYAERHAVLLRQIVVLLELLQSRFSCPVGEDITVFLAESLLNCSVKKYEYAQVSEAFMKLLNP